MKNCVPHGHIRNLAETPLRWCQYIQFSPNLRNGELINLCSLPYCSIPILCWCPSVLCCCEGRVFHMWGVSQKKEKYELVWALGTTLTVFQPTITIQKLQLISANGDSFLW